MCTACKENIKWCDHAPTTRGHSIAVRSEDVPLHGGVSTMHEIRFSFFLSCREKTNSLANSSYTCDQSEKYTDVGNPPPPKKKKNKRKWGGTFAYSCPLRGPVVNGGHFAARSQQEITVGVCGHLVMKYAWHKYVLYILPCSTVDLILTYTSRVLFFFPLPSSKSDRQEKDNNLKQLFR